MVDLFYYLHPKDFVGLEILVAVEDCASKVIAEKVGLEVVDHEANHCSSKDLDDYREDLLADRVLKNFKNK